MSRRTASRRASLLAAVLALALGAPLAPSARADDPTVVVAGSVRDASGAIIPGTAFLLRAPGDSGTSGDASPSNASGDPGDSADAAASGASVVDESPNGDDGFSFGPVTPGDYAARFESASPGLTMTTGSFAAAAESEVVDLTIPAPAAADVMVTGADGQPIADLTMEYTAESPGVDVGSGLTGTVTTTGVVTAADGHFAPLLYGPSTLTYTLSNGFAGEPITIAPGEQATVTLPDRPSAPRNVTATAGDGKVKLTWEPPAYDGGSPITGYTVTASRNSSNFKANFGANATSGAIRSLINGKTYTVTVVAKNANGAGAASAPLTVSLPADDPPPTTTTTTAPAHGSGDDPLGGAGTGGDPTGKLPADAFGHSGYWLLGADGAVFSFGDAAPHGDAAAGLAGSGGTVRAVDIEATPSGQGYWVLDSTGRVRPFGDADHLGDVPLRKLAPGEEPASISATPTGAGYWVFTTRGRALTFGDAAFLGDVSDVALNGPVLDSVATPSGRGYYMVAADGGIFAFGDARFAGSMGGTKLNAPVQSLVPDGDGAGYWLVASDGGVFAFDAPFRGSLGGVKLNKPVRGMVRYGDGYVMVAADGGIFAFSDRPFTGSLGAHPPATPVIAVAALP